MRWAITVCRRCGRLAEWPGCEHWETHRGKDPEGWTRTIIVRATPRVEAELKEEMDRLAGER